MIRVRKSTAEDVSILIDFQQRLAWESEAIKLDPEVLRKGMLSLFTDLSKGLYYVAVDNSEIVGCHMITYEWSDWRNGMVWWLQSVYVKESHRKSGVFRKMYENIIEQINNDPGVLGLRLYVDKSNAKAQQVYAAMGMDGNHYTVFEKMK